MTILSAEFGVILLPLLGAVLVEFTLGVSSPFSWLLIGVQSRFVHAASENAEIISPLYLMEETFVGPAFLLSALVLAIGGVIVWGVENGRICGVELLTKDPRVHRP
ncbi:MAG: hypothetical protein ACOX3V_03440 [Bacillota bacterium]